MSVLSVSWSRYQELLRTGRVANRVYPVYTDEKGIAWPLVVGNSVFDTASKPDEAKVSALMSLIETQRHK